MLASHGAWHKNALLVHRSHHSPVPRLAALFSFIFVLPSPSPFSFFLFFSVYFFCKLYPCSVPVPPSLCSILPADCAVPITATRYSLPLADATVFRSPAPVSDLRPLDRLPDSLRQQDDFTSLKPPC